MLVECNCEMFVKMSFDIPADKQANGINIVMSLSCTRARERAPLRQPRDRHVRSISRLHLPSFSLSLLIFPPFPPSSCAFLPENADGYLTSLPPPFKRESLLRLLLISSGLAIPLSHHFELLLLESVYNSRDNRMGWVHPAPIIRSCFYSGGKIRGNRESTLESYVIDGIMHFLPTICSR